MSPAKPCILLIALLITACGNDTDAPESAPPQPSPTVAAPTPVPTPETIADPVTVELGEGLSYRIHMIGTEGNTLEVGERGEFLLEVSGDDNALWNGRFAFVSGSGQGFPGLDRGTLGMRIGERRTIEMPATLGPESPDTGTVSTVTVDAILLSITDPQDK